MNKLSEETSPYLLQHAHNPVQWYAWKEEAFERARKEDKPILVSIGYSTCHWCHVMERESFEDPTIADFMNEYFINIKVDREERPDVDQIYMEACQIINGNGGWPLNCFLTPDKRPFYAGTYYPPEPNHGRPSWLQVLKNISNAFYNKRSVIEGQADRLLEVIRKSGTSMIKNEIGELNTREAFNPEFAEKIFTSIKERFDKVEGGFGKAPKFPGTMTLRFLLNYHYHSKNPEALEHALFSIDKMIRGGIYDQLGGGFARYTVDRAWLVPHFEKMLYDNALLVELLADAYKLTQNDLYKETIIETLEFINREMTDQNGAFYSALDADSEGEEGKFYVWSKKEVEDILGDSATLFCDFYDVTEQGNWEGKNILWRQKSFESFAKDYGLDTEELKMILKDCRGQLLKHRSSRVRPGLDDKIILSWNALQCSAYVNAYAAVGIEAFKKAAEKNVEFILNNMVAEDGLTLYHTYKDGKAQYKAFLNDYAFFIKALLDLYSVSFDEQLLEQAQRYLILVQENFFDKTDGLYYFTSEHQQDIIVRKKELYDSALPSGNSTMATNLLRLGIILDDEKYKELSANMLSSVKQSVESYAVSFSRWANASLNLVYPVKELAVVGKEAFELSKELNKLFLPGKLMMSTEQGESTYPLLKGRYSETETLIFLCQDYACQLPVKTVDELQKLLKSI